jgi:hypothetical protein
MLGESATCSGWSCAANSRARATPCTHTGRRSARVEGAVATSGPRLVGPQEISAKQTTAIFSDKDLVLWRLP